MITTIVPVLAALLATFGIIGGLRVVFRAGHGRGYKLGYSDGYRDGQPKETATEPTPIRIMGAPCPKCSRMIAAWPCQHCGYSLYAKPRVEQTDGTGLHQCVDCGEYCDCDAGQENPEHCEHDHE